MAATAEQSRIAGKLTQAATWFSGPRAAILRQLASDVLALPVTSAAPAAPKQAGAPDAEQPPPAPPAAPSSGAP